MALDPDAAPGVLRAPFVYRRRVAFAETDQAGIVHFSVFFRYMEEAEHAMWREAGLSIAAPGSDHGFPRVNASFDYRQPLRFEDEFEVRLHIDYAGARSVRYRAELWRGTDRIGAGTMTMACVSRRSDGTMKAVAIPDRVRRALGI